MGWPGRGLLRWEGPRYRLISVLTDLSVQPEHQTTLLFRTHSSLHPLGTREPLRAEAGSRPGLNYTTRGPSPVCDLGHGARGHSRDRGSGFPAWPGLVCWDPNFSTGNLTPKVRLRSPARAPILPVAPSAVSTSTLPETVSAVPEAGRGGQGPRAAPRRGVSQPRPPGTPSWLCEDGMATPQRGGAGDTRRGRDEFKVASVESSSPTTSFSCLPV